jgi:hypothetical protein
VSLRKRRRLDARRPRAEAHASVRVRKNNVTRGATLIAFNNACGRLLLARHSLQYDGP